MVNAPSWCNMWDLPLRKHTYSNILKISPPKTEIFQIKKILIFHISAQNIDYGYSLEPPWWGGSYEHTQSMFFSRNMKNNVYPCKPQFYYIKVGFKGSKLYRYVFMMHREGVLAEQWKPRQACISIFLRAICPNSSGKYVYNNNNNNNNNTVNPRYNDTICSQRCCYFKWICCCKESLMERMIFKKGLALFLFPHRTLCLGYLLESPHWGDSNKYLKHMLLEVLMRHSCISSP